MLLSFTDSERQLVSAEKPPLRELRRNQNSQEWRVNSEVAFAWWIHFARISPPERCSALKIPHTPYSVEDAPSWPKNLLLMSMSLAKRY